MLYNKDAVKDWKEPDSKNPLHESSKFLITLDERFTNDLSKIVTENTGAKTTLGRFRRLCSILEQNFPHEEMKKGVFKREYQGFRSAREVFLHGTGHCIELNNLLYASMKEVFPEILNPTIFLTKNPKGYSRKYGAGGYGIHSFVKTEIDGKEFLADIVAGTVRRKEKVICSCSQELSEIEYLSFLLADCAEDIGLTHRKYEEAITILNVSADLDQNQYPRLFVAAAIRYSQAMQNFEDKTKRTKYLKKMEQNLERGISMAPGIMDTWKTAGDLYFDSYISKKQSLDFYREAVERPSKDRDMTRGLYYKLIGMGQKDLAAILRRNNWNHLVG